MFPDQWWLTLEPPWGTVQMLLPPITFKSSDLEQNTLQNGLMIEFLNSTTELNLDPLAGHAAKPTYWYWVVVKESVAFITRPSKEYRQLMLKRTKLSNRLQGKVFEDKGAWSAYG